MTDPTPQPFLNQDPYLLLAFGALLLLLCLLIALLARDRRTIFRNAIRIQRLENELLWKQEELDTLLGERKEQQAFVDSLTNAAITTKLQQPRLNVQTRPEAVAPEKYGFLPRLVEKGMTASEIAELLAMSPTEASQLIRLAQLGGATKIL